jgi:SynChlorMet cassette radical SAM/SPASM protein ScmF
MGCEPELLKREATTMTTRKLDLPEGVPPLSSLYMYIAGSCNLACRHCWIEPDYQTDIKNGKFLKLEYIKKAVAEAKPLGLHSVKLTGGEPTLHPQIFEIVEYLDSENIAIFMETNGTLIDDKMARFLKSKPHFDFISVSVDGAKPETHDKLRGIKGSFKKAVIGIKTLSKAGFRPQIICTLHKGNIAESKDLIRLAESLGCDSVKFNLVQNMGRGDDFAEINGFKTKKIIGVFQNIERNIRPKSKINVYFDIPIAFKPIRNLLSGDTGRCTILNILSIISDGSISLCGIGVTIPELIFGHIAKDNLKHIWETSPKIRSLREEIPAKLKGICSDCMHRDLCLGTCVANNYHRTKSFSTPYFFCEDADLNDLFPRTRINSKPKGDNIWQKKQK